MIWNQDIIILSLCLLSAVIFVFLGNNRLFKFLFWVILWFLLFFIANLEIKLLTLSNISVASNVFENFILKNKDFILSFLTCMIPIFWVFLAINESISIKVRWGVYVSILLWGILPIFLLGLFLYILTYSSLPLWFLSDILSIFSGSFIFDFLKNNLHFVIYFLLFIIFYKIILTFFFTLLAKLFEIISNFINGLFSKKWEEEHDHGEDHHDEHGHDSHGSHDSHWHDKQHWHGHGGHH